MTCEAEMNDCSQPGPVMSPRCEEAGGPHSGGKFGWKHHVEV
jgi:hypothetical protein